MKTKLKKISFSRCLLAGLLCGVVTALIVIIYALFYRDITDFEKYTALSPVVIFIAMPVVMVVIAVIYFIFVHYIKQGEFLFITLFLALMLTSLLFTVNVPPGGNKIFLTRAHGLFAGMELIIALAACVFLPYLVRHPRIYMTYRQINWE